MKTAIIASSLIFLLLTSFIVLFTVFYYKRKRKHEMDNQKLKSDFQQELLQTQIEIQEQTLKSISQEIHDNVGQVLSLAKLNLGTFEPSENKSNQEKINDTRKLVSKAIQDLRDLSRSLHGDKLAELGLVESVGDELKFLENTGQYKTALRISGESCKLDPQDEILLFRIVQEAINNAIKHAKARNIEIEISYLTESFSISIIDDGNGFDVNKLHSGQKGIGLKSMQNRASLIGAEFTLNSVNGRGTIIKIKLNRSTI